MSLPRELIREILVGKQHEGIERLEQSQLSGLELSCGFRKARGLTRLCKALANMHAGWQPELLELTYDEINMQAVKLVMKTFAVLQNSNLSPL